MNKSQRIAATVVDNRDPKQSGRVKVRHEAFHAQMTDEELPWATPATQSGGGVVSIDVPEIGEKVFVDFKDVQEPVYFFNVLTESNLDSELTRNYPDRKGYVDKLGNTHYRDMKTGDFMLKHSSGVMLRIDSEGNITGLVSKDLVVTAEKDVIIDGKMKVIINSSDSVEIHSKGDTTIDAEGKMTLIADSDSEVNVDGPLNIIASGETNIEATEGSNVNVESAGAMVLKSVQKNTMESTEAGAEVKSKTKALLESGEDDAEVKASSGEAKLAGQTAKVVGDDSATIDGSSLVTISANSVGGSVSITASTSVNLSAPSVVVGPFTFGAGLPVNMPLTPNSSGDKPPISFSGVSDFSVSADSINFNTGGSS